MDAGAVHSHVAKLRHYLTKAWSLSHIEMLASNTHLTDGDDGEVDNPSLR